MVAILAPLKPKDLQVQETAGGRIKKAFPCIWWAAGVNVEALLIVARNARVGCVMGTPPRQFERREAAMQTRTNQKISAYAETQFNQENEEGLLLCNVPDRISPNGSGITATLLLSKIAPLFVFDSRKTKKNPKKNKKTPCQTVTRCQTPGFWCEPCTPD